MLKPTVDDYIMFTGLREAVAQSSLANPTVPARTDVVDAVIEYAIDLAQSEVLSYLGDRYERDDLELATGLPRMILQIARWNLDQRIEPRDFIRDQYNSVLEQLKAIAAHEAGLWLQELPIALGGSSAALGGSSATTETGEPPPLPSSSSPVALVSFGGGDLGFGDVTGF